MQEKYEQENVKFPVFLKKFSEATLCPGRLKLVTIIDIIWGRHLFRYREKRKF